MSYLNSLSGILTGPSEFFEQNRGRSYRESLIFILLNGIIAGMILGVAAYLNPASLLSSELGKMAGASLVFVSRVLKPFIMLGAGALMAHLILMLLEDSPELSETFSAYALSSAVAPVLAIMVSALQIVGIEYAIVVPQLVFSFITLYIQIRGMEELHRIGLGNSINAGIASYLVSGGSIFIIQTTMAGILAVIGMATLSDTGTMTGAFTNAPSYISPS